MSLHLHRAERAGRLVDALAELLAVSSGRFLRCRVGGGADTGRGALVGPAAGGPLGARPGHADGVCATVDFPTLSSLVEVALGPGTDPPLRLHRYEDGDARS